MRAPVHVEHYTAEDRHERIDDSGYGSRDGTRLEKEHE